MCIRDRVQGVREIADAAVPKALTPITRMADSVEIRRMRQNREDEKRAYRTCQECIARHGLEMKLVAVSYTHLKRPAFPPEVRGAFCYCRHFCWNHRKCLQ